jgi:hypothetical protein
MSLVTRELHEALLHALGGAVSWHSGLDDKPLLLDLLLPLPPRLRVYMYSLVVGGPNRRGEYKVVVRVPGQLVGKYDSFDHSGSRLALLIGYRVDLDVFVLWDASLHSRFKNGGNIQVRGATVYSASGSGRAIERRRLSGGRTEVVIACQSGGLSRALDDRVSWTGVSAKELWATCLS